MHRPRNRLLLAAACVSIAVAALAQDRPESILPPGFGEPAPATNTQSPAPASNATTTAPAGPRESSGVVESDALTLEEAADAMVVEVAPPVEMPDRCAARPGRGRALAAGADRPWRPAVGRVEREIPVDPDAPHRHAAGVALGAHPAPQRPADQGTGAGRREPRRLGRRARLAADPDGRGGRRADAGGGGRCRRFHPQAVPDRGAKRARQRRSLGVVPDRERNRQGRADHRAAGPRDVRVAVGQ